MSSILPLFTFLFYTGVPLPLNWCPQPNESSGNEKEVHLVELDPTSNSSEYNKVAEGIRKTASISITKIERVQTPGLYKAYVVKKDQMEQTNGANEKLLFHGTAQGSCSSINKFGFNRSFCGKNGKSSINQNLYLNTMRFKAW